MREMIHKIIATVQYNRDYVRLSPMNTYLLRYDDDALWRKVKSKAAAEGMTAKEIILQLLAEWVKKK